MSFECLLSLCLLSYLGAGLYVYNLILLMDVFNNWLENSWTINNGPSQVSQY